jgi:uncharacterized HhH-GPD family protein
MVIDKKLIESLFLSIKKYNTPRYTAFLKGDLEKDKVLSSNPNMLMIMWLMSAQYDAEKASYIPFLLEERLGSCDMNFLASLPLADIERAMSEPTPVHRFPQKRASYLWQMAKLITDKYNGDVENIWQNVSSIEISRRLREIPGFGQKLSSMVPINLIRNLGIHLSDQVTMDIAVDVHVERVLKRTGLCHQDADYAEMALTARKIAEQEGRFAMELDLPLWATGKFFCHKDNAECGDCPLNNVCSKIFDKKNDYIAKANIRKPCICKNCSKI